MSRPPLSQIYTQFLVGCWMPGTYCKSAAQISSVPACSHFVTVSHISYRCTKHAGQRSCTVTLSPSVSDGRVEVGVVWSLTAQCQNGSRRGNEGRTQEQARLFFIDFSTACNCTRPPVLRISYPALTWTNAACWFGGVNRGTPPSTSPGFRLQ